jgi:hypothetical protein
MRFDDVIDSRDDDGAVRLAYLVGEDPDRIPVIVSRGVGKTHALSIPADRLVDYDPPPVHAAAGRLCAWHGPDCRARS